MSAPSLGDSRPSAILTGYKLGGCNEPLRFNNSLEWLRELREALRHDLFYYKHLGQIWVCVYGRERKPNWSGLTESRQRIGNKLRNMLKRNKEKRVVDEEARRKSVKDVSEGLLHVWMSSSVCWWKSYSEEGQTQVSVRCTIAPWIFFMWECIISEDNKVFTEKLENFIHSNGRKNVWV